jgi:queuine tRNA-ribosyltransferase
VLYTDVGRVRITDRRYRNDLYPPDTHCDCTTCTRFSRAYLHHLFRVGEILGPTLATVHNLRWFARFMASMRQALLEGSFPAFRDMVRQRHGGTSTFEVEAEEP